MNRHTYNSVKAQYTSNLLIGNAPTPWLRISCLFLLAICFDNLSAQTFHPGSWNIMNIKYNPSEKWSLFGEAQLRSLHFYDDFHYYEYKGGINYKAGKNIALTIGAGSYQTFAEGGNFVEPKNNDEFRLWPQITLFQTIGKIKIEQRYRAEQRFTSNGYRNRFRYRIGASYSFGKENSGYKPYQISASNEIFFTDKEPYFERNRALVAFNWKTSRSSSIQVGYLKQFDYKINDETGRDFLVVGLYFELFGKTALQMEQPDVLKEN
jgi:hypothetical protein